MQSVLVSLLNFKEDMADAESIRSEIVLKLAKLCCQGDACATKTLQRLIPEAFQDSDELMTVAAKSDSLESLTLIGLLVDKVEDLNE